jgi:hypothetical protein
MKPIITALGIVVMLLLSSTANGQSDFTWTGEGATASWSDTDNWDPDSSYPGAAAGDTATIYGSPARWPVLNLTPGNGLASLTMRDGSSGSPTQISTGTYTLTVGTFTVSDTDSACYIQQLGDGEIDTDYMDIIAGDSADEDAVFKLYAGTLDAGTLTVQAAHSVAANATLYVWGGTCEPGTLDFQGSGSSSYGYAIGWFDAGATVGTSTTADGFVVIDIDTDMTLQPKATTIGSTAHATDVQIGFDDSPGTGTFQPTTLTIQAGDGAGEDTVLRHTAGTLDTSSALSVQASHSAAADATLWVADGTCTPYSMEFEGSTTSSSYGHAVANFDADVTVDSGSTTTAIGYTDIDVASGKTFTARTMTVGTGTDFGYVQQTGSGTLDSDSVTIQATSSHGSTLDIGTGSSLSAASTTLDGYDGTYTSVVSGSGTLSTRSLTTDAYSTVSVSTLEMAAASDASASLEIPTTGTVTPTTLRLKGYSQTYTSDLDVDDDKSVTNVEVISYANIDVYRGKTLSPGTLTVGSNAGNGASAQLSISATDGNSGTGDVSCSSITINGGDAGSVVTVANNARLYTN